MTGRKLLLLAASVVVVLVGAFGAVGFLAVGSTTSPQASAATVCAAQVAGDAGPGLDSDQAGNAKIIVTTGLSMRVPVKGLVVAIATARQESALHNLPGGDRDSIGLFQQRPSQGWGTPAQVGDPVYASTAFYTHLLAVPGWESMPVWQAAQSVQHSGFPTAYARWEAMAWAAVTGLLGSTAVTNPSTTDCATGGTTTALPSGTVGVMLRFALAQVGKPYVWGATGPDSYDCSGLIVASYRAAGFALTVRTAAQMYGVSTPIPAGQEQPGDLAFSEFGARGAGPGHVTIVLGGGKVVEAPYSGANVHVRGYSVAGEGIRFGRLQPQVLVPIGGTA